MSLRKIDMLLIACIISMILFLLLTGGCAYRGVGVYGPSGSGETIVEGYHHIVKVLNGLRYDVELRAAAGRLIVLRSGEEVELGYPPTYFDNGSRRIILTAAVMENGKVIGTITRTIRISAWSDQEIWHITYFATIKQR